MDGPRVFLIEFNELSPTLLARFMTAGRLPQFARLYGSSDVFVTDAGELGGTLVPWIQWPSVHTGLPYGEHGIFHLGDGTEAASPTIGSVLSAAGVAVGQFGAMNVPVPAGLRGFALPDPWDKRGRAEPASLQPYYDVIAEQVKESSQHGRLTARDAVKLGWFYLRNGFRAATAWTLLRQLVAERFDPRIKWRRAALLDQIQYDVFRTYVRRCGVRFASFFSNSTAHYQHLYWRDMEPAAFPDPPEPRAHASQRDAVPFGYRMMDALIGRFLDDFPGATFVFATGLSQEPYTGPVLRNYRPVSFERLLAFAGIAGASVAPVMSEEFHLDFASEDAANAAAAALGALEIDGVPALNVTREGAGLFCGCRYLDPTVLERPLVDRRSGASRPFAELFYLVDGFRSGHHHPDGALWIRTGGDHHVHERRASILDIAPTVLSFFGVQAPAAMQGRVLPLGGRAEVRPLTAI